MIDILIVRCQYIDKETALAVLLLRQIVFGNRLVFAVQGGYFFMVNTIKKVLLVFKWAALRKNLFAGFTLQSFCVTIIWV